MKEIYDWVPWFRELARTIAQGSEQDLIDKAKTVDWGSGSRALLDFGNDGIDPFSFFYFLAQKNTTKKRSIVYPSVHETFNIQETRPDETRPDDCYIFPTPPPMATALFHDGKTFRPSLLWRLFRQAVGDNPNVGPDDFWEVLNIGNVDVTKLTQTLFLINAEYFLPIDDTTGALQDFSLNELRDNIRREGLQEYLSVINNLKEAFPDCRPYEIAGFSDLQSKNQPPGGDAMKHPLNRILYGPPGTGKTWSTVNYAVAIAEEKDVNDVKREERDDVRARFDELKERGQIAMVTFHQSFTYEDFIESISPVLDDESENVRYELSKGIFREIAERASERRNLIVLFRNSSDSSDAAAASSKARPDANGALPETVPASGLYVDIENLQNHGQRVVLTLAESWPLTAPPLKSLTLYVRADMAELWRAWATSSFPSLDVVVRGIQHFTQNTSKNSADIAITANAMADWLLGRVSHVAVISDDSDFISLYTAMRQELARRGEPGADVPFLWILTDRQKTVSEVARQFFPPNLIHVISTSEPEPSAPIPEPKPEPAPPQAASAGGNGAVLPIPAPQSPPPTGHAPTDIARAIVASIPVGSFKSTDCVGIIRNGWPNHPLALADGSAFGTEFKNTIWPILRLWGVRIPNQRSKPLRYEMTDAAKRNASR